MKCKRATGDLPFLLSIVTVFGMVTTLAFMISYVYYARYQVLVVLQDTPSLWEQFQTPADYRQQQSVPPRVPPTQHRTNTSSSTSDKMADRDMNKRLTLNRTQESRNKTQTAPPVSVAIEIANQNDSTTHRSGYIMTFSYDEQLESAMYDIYQLANLAAAWNMQIAEPFVQGSFFGIPKRSARTAAEFILQFRDVYNMTAVNRQFGKCLHVDYPIIAKFENCISEVFQHVILVKFTWGKVPKKCTKDLRDKHKDIEHQINHWAKHVLENSTWLPSNVVTNQVCVDVTREVDFKRLPISIPAWSKARMNTMQSHSKILILILDWHGIRKKWEPFFYYDPHYKQMNCREVHSISHSNSVILAAQEYYRFLKLVRPFLGIHIRLERLVEDDKPNSGYMKQCIDKLLTVVGLLVEKYHLNYENVIAFRDYGPFGSFTCRLRKCSQPAKELHIDDRLNSLKIRTVEYDPRKFQRPNSKGFSSFVEKELLSTADYLLTVGKGSFQASITQRFLDNQGQDGDQKLFTLCSTTYGERLHGLKL